MIVLGLDFETTGLDASRDRVIEIGAVLWDTTRACPLELLSTLCIDDGIPNPLPAEIEQITGLTYEMLDRHGDKSANAFNRLFHLAMPAEAIVAHNAPFDKGFYDAELKRTERSLARPWIDTVTDLKYPAQITTRKLTHLAAEHGFVNPFQHRAVFDVLTMLRIFQQYDAAEALAYSQQPPVTLLAVVSYDDREKAKARGYRWASDRRQWLKTVRQPDVAVEQANPDFKVVTLQT